MGFPKDVRVIETMIGTRAGESKTELPEPYWDER